MEINTVRYFPARANSNIVASSRRLLMLFKPDALSCGHVPEALKIISEGMERENIPFRFVGPALIRPSSQFIEKVYSEHAGKDWFISNFSPFMTGCHPVEDVVRSPLLSMMLEFKDDHERDLVKTVREKIIGPTDPEQDPSPISTTLRFRLTLGKGLPVWPMPDIETAPIYNRMHCSADIASARSEVSAVYGGRDVLEQYYDAPSLASLRSECGDTGYGNDTSAFIPLLRYAGLNPLLSASEVIDALSSGYRDFGKDRAAELLEGFNGLSGVFRSAEEKFFDAAGAGPRQKPRILAMFGAPGSGKTSIVDKLKASGAVSLLLPLVVNEEREVQGAQEYQLWSKDRIMEGIRKGELIGWETLSGNFYALSRDTLLEIVRDPLKTYAIIAGPSVVHNLEKQLGDNAVVHNVMAFVPEEELALRIEERDTARDKQRGTGLSIDTQRWLAGAVDFDLTVKNSAGKLDQAARAAELFLSDPVKCSADGIRRASTVLGMQLFNMMELLKNNTENIPVSDIDALESYVRSLMHRPIFDLLSEVLDSAAGDGASLSVKNSRFLAEVAEHTLLVLCAGIQLRLQQYDAIIAQQKRFGRLGMAEPARAEKLYERLRQIQESIHPDEEILFTLLHDIGKVDDIPNHQTRGYELCGMFGLLKGWDIPGLDPELNRLAIMHSHLLGSHILPDYSVIGLADAIADPGSRSVLARQDGSVDLERVEGLLDRLLLFTCKDSSGYGSGFLRVMIAERYIDVCDRLLGIFTRNSGNFDAAIREIRDLGPSSNRERLSRFAAIEDMSADLNRRDSNYYWDKIILQGKDSAVRDGHITPEDWNMIDSTLHHVSRFGYASTALADHLQFIGNDTEHVENFVNYGNFLKLLSIICKSVTAFSADPSSPDDFEFRFVDKDNKEIVEYDRLGLAMQRLNGILGRLTTGTDKKGGKISVITASGADEQEIELCMEQEKGRKLISLKLLDF